jgi:putative radical SAM enzyme (TIGR03279 family)
MLSIRAIVAGSPAQKAGLKPGFKLAAINGHAVEDELDLRFLQSGDNLRLAGLDSRGRKFSLRVRKHPDQDLGLRVVETPIRGCGARCVFCFSDQNPRGLRSTLYFKDEDYRMSFLHGAYVTLANLKDKDLARILRLRLSPLYISVHATDEAVRRRLLGLKKPANILGLLKRLAKGRIQVHTQIVVAPGYNDGPVLEKTVKDLAGLYPWVASIALVPVGLTRHRKSLPKLRLSTPQEARHLLARLAQWQGALLKSKGTRLVFAADEWYLRARGSLPAFGEYEDFPQAANGVGLIRAFEKQWARSQASGKGVKGRATLVTGQAFGPTLKRLVRGFNVEVAAIPNRFYGDTVTVAGLLCGQDVARFLKRSKSKGPVLVPDVMLKHGGQVFLDDMSLSELQKALGRKVVKVSSDAKGLAAVLRS